LTDLEVLVPARELVEVFEPAFILTRLCSWLKTEVIQSQRVSHKQLQGLSDPKEKVLLHKHNDFWNVIDVRALPSEKPNLPSTSTDKAI
jgi:hypothetical protein